jgi:ubiquinol-cytochrome c reductase iron-sulfur subunit
MSSGSGTNGNAGDSGNTGDSDAGGGNEGNGGNLPRESGEPALPEPRRGDGPTAGERRGRGPERVIGTPPPAESRYLLAAEGGGARAGTGGPDGGDSGRSEHDEAAARRAERIVALCFSLAFVGGIGFIASYVIFGVGTLEKALLSNLFLGSTMTLAFLGLAVGVTVWVRSIMTTPETTQQRTPLPSDAEDKKAFTEHFLRGADESGVARRPLLRRTLLAAMVPLGLAPLVLLRDLGPLPGTTLRHTDWKKGTRLVVDGTGQPIRADGFTVGSMVHILPEDEQHNLESIAKTAVILVAIPPEKMKPVKGRENWAVNNSIIAYSKICTHVGCPAGLYEQNTHHILCPCHQSTFDATDGARVIFGPAARPLPQLPIAVDAEGYLIAQSDFHEPVGPSFWERGETKS